MQRSEEPSRPPLTPVHLRRRIEGKIISLLLSTLTEEFPEKTVRDTVRYLLKASATRGSLHSARTTGKRGRSDRQMRRVLATIDSGKLQRLFTYAFRRQVRPCLPKGKVILATDSHLVPYWGDSHRTQHILASQAKQGTNSFHGYSTLYLAGFARRLTISFRQVRGRRHMVRMLHLHLRDAQQLGLKIEALLLDREYYSFEVLDFLLSRGIPFLMPVQAGAQMLARWRKEHGRKSFHTTHTLKGGHGRTLTVQIHVVKRYKKGRRGEHGIEVLPYVISGLHRLTPEQTRKLYRTRFGIEGSYRLAGAARARTSSRNATLRMFYLAVALFLENEWVTLKLIHLSEKSPGRRGFVVRDEKLRFKHLLALLLWGLGRVLG
ncbi:MAG: transposase, partial [Nitrososphaerota archaeon]|nr:transposase [Nitrososphaerota archaeon]